MRGCPSPNPWRCCARGGEPSLHSCRSASTGAPIRGLHGGSGGGQNDFLNQRTANATGLSVRAGPVEATALGNLAVQAIHDGAFADLHAARHSIGSSFRAKAFAP